MRRHGDDPARPYAEPARGTGRKNDLLRAVTEWRAARRAVIDHQNSSDTLPRDEFTALWNRLAKAESELFNMDLGDPDGG